MVTTLKCASCGTALKLREGYVKTLKEFKCLRCGAPIPLPGAAASADDAAASTRHIPMRPILPGGTPSPAAAATSTSTGGGTISVTCSGCGRTMTLRAELAGKKVRCKQCQAVTLVPETAGEPSPVAATPPPPTPSPTAPRPTAAPPPPSQPSAPSPTAREAGAEPATSPAPVPAPAREADGSAVAASEMAELRRRAEKAELALRAMAAQHAEKTADLLHQIETLKRELAEARATPAGLSREAVARAVDAWTEERRRRVDEEAADLRRRLALG